MTPEERLALGGAIIELLELVEPATDEPARRTDWAALDDAALVDLATRALRRATHELRAMEWRRTGGNASEEYMALVEALHVLGTKVAGCEPTADIDVPDDDLLFAIGELVIEDVERRGIAR